MKNIKFAPRVFALLILLFVCGVSPAQAKDEVETVKEFSYLPLDFTSGSGFNDDFDQVFTSSRMRADVFPGAVGLELPIAWLNRVYSGRGKAFVYAKGGLFIKGAVEYGKVYALSTDAPKFVVHVPQFDRGDHVFYFEGFSREACEEFSKKLMRVGQRANEKSVSSSPLRRRFFALLVSRARADEAGETAIANAYCMDQVPGAEVQSEASSLSSDLVKKCGGSFLKGLVWDSTVGVAQFGLAAVGGLYSTVRSTLNGEIFEKISKFREDFARFTENFNNQMEQFYAGAASLPFDEKATILCELAGALGSGLVVSYFTAGAGSGAIARAIANAFAKVRLKGGSSIAQRVNQMAGGAKAGAKNYRKQNIRLQKMARTEAQNQEALARARALDAEAKFAWQKAEGDLSRYLAANPVVARQNLKEQMATLQEEIAKVKFSPLKTATKQAEALKFIRNNYELQKGERALIDATLKDYRKALKPSFAFAFRSESKRAEIANANLENFARLQREFDGWSAPAFLEKKAMKVPEGQLPWGAYSEEEMRKMSTKVTQLNAAYIERNKEMEKVREAVVKASTDHGKALNLWTAKKAIVAGGAGEISMGLAACDIRRNIPRPRPEDMPAKTDDAAAKQ